MHHSQIIDVFKSHWPVSSWCPKLLLCGHMYAYVYVCACMPLRLLTNTQVKSNSSLKFKCPCVTKRFLVIRPRLRDFLENAIKF